MGTALNRMKEDHQLVGLLLANGAGSTAHNVLTTVEPLLGPILTFIQILVGAITFVWIWRRVRGAELDNKFKEKKLRPKRK